ncbi:MAG: phenylalanine--tRNA ligase subunit beta [Oscillospiraceae bacterium]|nr:phenylalanine--tRNA ligase subunit beta [Oscillospiraceae bacterium]
MNLSRNWLQEYVDVADIDNKTYNDALTMSGSKIEGYDDERDHFSRVVIGRVESIERHPNADKLFVCQVNVGSETVQICTSAQNLHVGAVVPVALDGSDLPGGIHIKAGEMRGVQSCGMMCSFNELGLTEHDCPEADPNGIWLLQGEYTLGQEVTEALGLNDTCVEFEITPNRPDCLSVIGLARETAATFGRELKLHTPVVKGCGGNIHDMLKVDVLNGENCLRYCAKVVKNIKVEPSPKWMRDRLRVSGVRPINNIVDITNYVMLEYGNPMHAFDLALVDGGHIVVRNAVDGETIETLDGVVRTLTGEMLVIADENKPSAVAGIMGSETSGINDNTNTVVFESACFKGSNVRRTGRKLGMRTESSGRFEKGLDSDLCMPALLRACELIELLGAGEVVDGVIDVYPNPKQQTKILLEVDYINRFLGTDISREQMIAYLQSLEFTMDGDYVLVPSFRDDVKHKADLAEEVARLYGYNNIPITLPKANPKATLTAEQKFERSAVRAMLGLGYTEIISYTFVSPKFYDTINLPADSPLRKSVTILNPLGEDTSMMRTTALPSMLQILQNNYANRNMDCSIFELAKEFTPKESVDELPDEKVKLMIGAYGKNGDFYTLKGQIDALLKALSVGKAKYEAVTDNPSYHPGRCAKLSVNGTVIGIMGEVHPLVMQNYGMKTKAYVADLDMPAMMSLADTDRHYHPLPKFPAVTRDLALVCDEAVTVGSIAEVIEASCGSLLEKVQFFDVYRGAQVGEGKKSVAYSIVLRSETGTLSDKEADAAVEAILNNLAPMGVTLR